MTEQQQREFPSLPIPELSETIEQYLKRIRALVGNRQYEETCEKVRRFAAGPGPKLQERLQEWDWSVEGSWLKPFWEESYLTFRGELPGNMNYSFLLDQEKLPVEMPLEMYCARVIRSLTDLYLDIARGEQEPEYSKQAPLCMEQYDRIFRSCRMPAHGEDKLMVSEKSVENLWAALAYQGNLFLIPVTSDTGKACSLEQLAGAVSMILERDWDPEFPVGIYTTAAREKAADFVSHLTGLADGNRENLERFQDALFLLCVDETDAADESERFWQILYSDGRNRFFDKGTQVIVGMDHSIGINNEHTGYDGAVYMSVMETIYQGLGRPATEPSGCPADSLTVDRLRWETDEYLTQAAQEMEQAHRARGEQLTVRLVEFNEFGKDAVKKVGMSPDAFFHLALHMAWYQVFGSVANAYEAVAVRQFYQGRTECGRSSSPEVQAFLEALSAGEDQKRLGELAHEMAGAHSQALRACQQGRGPERHLFGLDLMRRSPEGELRLAPEEDIFADPSYQLLKHDTLSTSGLSSPLVQAFGFGPVVEDGFGVGYGILEDRFRLCLSCWESRREQFPVFIDELKKAFRTLLELL